MYKYNKKRGANLYKQGLYESQFRFTHTQIYICTNNGFYEKSMGEVELAANGYGISISLQRSPKIIFKR